MMRMVVWMEVTKDKYELPVAVADDAYKLSELTGASVNNIRSTVCRYEHGEIKRSRFVRVEMEEDE